MPEAVLQTRPAPHHGLGVDAYVAITAPGSRYTDWLMHQQMLGFVSEGCPAYSEAELDETLLYSLSARKTAPEIEAAARRYWLIRYLESREGRELEAVVLDRTGPGYQVELTETRLRAFCLEKRHVRLAPGAQVRLRLIRACARAGLLRLQL